MREIKAARKAYVKYEPRDLFYRAATALVNLATCGKVPISTAEALAVLLQTWNKAYYQYRPFDGRHFAEIERLLAKHQQTLAAFRKRTVAEFSSENEGGVEKVFSDFEQVLGPVGASKCLHLLAPGFFPLWDRGIARAYHLALWARGWNANRYCRFMTIAREQVKSLGGQDRLGPNPLKAIDEYN
jgi:hypothetical protein